MFPENLPPNEMRMLGNTTKRMADRSAKAYAGLRKLTAANDAEADVLHNLGVNIAAVKESAEILNEMYGMYSDPEGVDPSQLLPPEPESYWSRLWRSIFNR